MESDYQSLFQVRLANYDDIPAIMNITREAFVKYQQMSGVENLAALEESYNDVKKEISGGCKETTNNIMELTAVIEGLKMLKYPCEVDLYSDSNYVVNAFKQGWIYNWMKNNWKTASKEPVKNKEIWQELYELTKIHKVNFIKVKGHSDNEFNNRCDEMARNAIKSL